MKSNPNQITGFQIKSFVLKSNHHQWFNHDLNQIMIWICPSLLFTTLRSWVEFIFSFQYISFVSSPICIKQYVLFCYQSQLFNNWLYHGTLIWLLYPTQISTPSCHVICSLLCTHFPGITISRISSNQLISLSFPSVCPKISFSSITSSFQS